MGYANAGTQPVVATDDDGDDQENVDLIMATTSNEVIKTKMTAGGL